MAKKYVIVGANIDIYGEYESISGAQKSALDWKSFLDEKGFESKEILTDKNASRENTLVALTTLFANLKKDDFAVFIYIGHGKQIKDEYKNYLLAMDESDGLDEILVCNGTSVTDDEIRILLSLNKKRAPVFILIDACYNGVVEKNFQALTHFPSNNEVAFSSATQLEAAYMEDHNQTKQAVFSTFLLKTIAENPDKSYNEIFDLTREKLKKEDYPQNPQLAFTNYAILSNTVFTTPVITSTLKFTPQELIGIKDDPYKGQTQLEHSLEGLKLIHTIKINNSKNN